jgi:hypothetical protein
MKLFEFFGHQNLDFSPAFDHDDKKKASEKTHEQKDQMNNDVFWHIVDHDKLHKRHFFNVARHVKEKFGDDDNHDPKLWQDLVKDGCVDFYHKHKMKGDIKELFDQDFRTELCHKLADHYHKDITDDKHYKLGQ